MTELVSRGDRMEGNHKLTEKQMLHDCTEKWGWSGGAYKMGNSHAMVTLAGERKELRNPDTIMVREISQTLGAQRCQAAEMANLELGLPYFN